MPGRESNATETKTEAFRMIEKSHCFVLISLDGNKAGFLHHMEGVTPSEIFNIIEQHAKSQVEIWKTLTEMNEKVKRKLEREGVIPK